MICENISVNALGHLTFAVQDTVALAEKYGTPVYLFDEDRIRRNLHVYQDTLREAFHGNAQVLYAGKAAAFSQLYRILEEEKAGIDVVSGGEIYTAYKAGFDLKRAFFHGNNKLPDEIRLALETGVGCIVADNPEELDLIEKEAVRKAEALKEKDTEGSVFQQKVLLRITPGIDTHTYEAVNTGKVDSKFGNAIATGQAEAILKHALSLPHIKVAGFHCHVGSQVFAEDVFERAAKIMLTFIADMRDRLGYTAEMLDLGGGYGVRYVDTDPFIDVSEKIRSVAATVYETCEALSLPVPEILMEPGRSIVADAGMTLYTSGAVKRIPGYKTYVPVDGGMTDNPRYALYRSSYTCLNASRMNEDADMVCSVVGKCCESGDILQENVKLPEGTKPGDILAVCTTGAYNYSMSSNYNRIPKPPVIMLKNGESYVAVKRETWDDLLRNDL